MHRHTKILKDAQALVGTVRTDHRGYRWRVDHATVIPPGRWNTWSVVLTGHVVDRDLKTPKGHPVYGMFAGEVFHEDPE